MEKPEQSVNTVEMVLNGKANIVPEMDWFRLMEQNEDSTMPP